MGSVLAIIRENLPPKSTFKVDDVPDLEGKVIIITGANAGENCLCPSIMLADFNGLEGVGKETAKATLYST